MKQSNTIFKIFAAFAFIISISPHSNASGLNAVQMQSVYAKASEEQLRLTKIIDALGELETALESAQSGIRGGRFERLKLANQISTALGTLAAICTATKAGPVFFVPLGAATSIATGIFQSIMYKNGQDVKDLTTPLVQILSALAAITDVEFPDRQSYVINLERFKKILETRKLTESEKLHLASAVSAAMTPLGVVAAFATAPGRGAGHFIAVIAISSAVSNLLATSASLFEMLTNDDRGVLSLEIKSIHEKVSDLKDELTAVRLASRKRFGRLN